MPHTLVRRLRGATLSIMLAASAPMAAASGLSGSYLAAMQADFRNDYAAAAEYYGRALAGDPKNLAILQNAAVAEVAAGDMTGAVALASRLAADIPENQMAGLILITSALRDEDYERAAALLGAAEAGDFNPLLAGLLAGWIDVGRENVNAGIVRFDALGGNETIAAYGQYHKALALALAGDFVSAEAILAGGPDGPLYPERGAVLAHAEILAQIDRTEEAIALLDEALSDGFSEPTLARLRDRLRAGEDVAFTQVTQATDGAADALLTLAMALNTENSDRFALIYARLAAHVRPDLTEARLLAAEILERHEQYELATTALADVPEDSPWYVTSELRRAATQRAVGDEEAGIATLQALAERHGDRIEVHSALGDALRVAERFEESAAAYGEAIALIDAPTSIHWVLYYTRAIAYERSGQWELAETDFRQALELQPDQPLVLNYLGYSLVEKRRNLDEALAMIERAVAGQPDDGYITDSLGWVLYRLGRYEEAVPHMLRAVELTPYDPIINDHLGDVLWMVGRKREADFQWRRALSLGPADDLDMDRIRRKLEMGLDQVLAEEQTDETDG